MLLTEEEIKQQTRALWRTCLNSTEEFLDIYFSEKYKSGHNFTIRRDGRVVSALQVCPYRFTYYGAVQHAACLAGLATLPEYRRRGFASQLLSEAHRKMYRQDTTVSFLIPQDKDSFHFYEAPERGGYRTCIWRQTAPIDTSEDGAFDHITVTQPDDWGHDLYVVYNRMSADIPFMLHPSEDDFFAALEAADLQDGYVLAAHMRGRLVGVCVAVKEADGRVFIRSFGLCYREVRAAFVSYLCRVAGVDTVYRRYCTTADAEGAEPYAMARIVDVQRFLERVASKDKSAHFHIRINGDAHLPENNGNYYVEKGKVYITPAESNAVMTPGELAETFIGRTPIVMDLLLNE